MSTADWQQPAGGIPPGGPGASRRGIWVKLTIVLLILAILAWVILLAADYLKTGQPITDLGPLPKPVADLLYKPSFRYVTSVEGVQSPLGVAIGKDGRVYVTESGGERKVHIFNSLGQEVGAFAPPATEVPDPVPVYAAVSPTTGDVYVSDRGAAAIFTFSADGAFQGAVTPPAGFEDWHPLGLTFDEAGNLYVADVTPEKHRVIVLDPRGQLKLSFGSQGEEDGQFWYPNGVAVDSQGRIFVADSNNGRMQAFDMDGQFLFKISRGMSPGDLSMPRGIAVDSEGRLLIADTSRGAVQAYEISKSAGSDPQSAPVKFLGSFSGSGASGSFLQFPNGLALDGHGNIYVADRVNNRVQVWKY